MISPRNIMEMLWRFGPFIHRHAEGFDQIAETYSNRIDGPLTTEIDNNLRLCNYRGEAANWYRFH